MRFFKKILRWQNYRARRFFVCRCESRIFEVCQSHVHSYTVVLKTSKKKTFLLALVICEDAMTLRFCSKSDAFNVHFCRIIPALQNLPFTKIFAYYVKWVSLIDKHVRFLYSWNDQIVEIVYFWSSFLEI